MRKAWLYTTDMSVDGVDAYQWFGFSAVVRRFSLTYYMRGETTTFVYHERLDARLP